MGLVRNGGELFPKKQVAWVSSGGLAQRNPPVGDSSCAGGGLSEGRI